VLGRCATKLDLDFYEREDVVQAGRDLLGKVLATHIDGISRARSSRRRKPMRVSPIGRVMPSADDV